MSLPLSEPLTKVVAISGASGAGKTTLVKHLAKRFDCPFFVV
jgi:uridine kinase